MHRKAPCVGWNGFMPGGGPSVNSLIYRTAHSRTPTSVEVVTSKEPCEAGHRKHSLAGLTSRPLNEPDSALDGAVIETGLRPPGCIRAQCRVELGNLAALT